MPPLDAAAANLARWREQMQVIDNTGVHYAWHPRIFGWSVAAGLMDRKPADALPLPPLMRGLPGVVRLAIVAAAGSSPSGTPP